MLYLYQRQATSGEGKAMTVGTGVHEPGRGLYYAAVYVKIEEA